MEGNNSPKRVVLIHHHIFKNAGTSFNFALKKAFGDGFFEYDLPNSQVVTSDNLASYLENNKKAVAVSGHHICLPAPQTENIQTLSSVLIRHPLARVRSIYEFERKQDAQTEGAIMAKQLNFKDFVSWRLETNSQVFCNYQTLYCCRIGNLIQSYNPTHHDLSLAIENINSCLVCGTVERYQQFLMMVQYELGLYFPNIVFCNAHLNFTKSHTSSNSRQKDISLRDRLCIDLGDDIVEKLDRKNQLDYQLYELVHRKLDNWIAEDIDEKASYFEIARDYWVKEKKWDNAKIILKHLVSLKPSSFKPYHDLGEALNRLGDSKEAIEKYQKAIELNPSFAWSYFRMAEILHQHKEFQQAELLYNLAIKNHIHEKSLTMYIKLSRCLVDQEKIDEALSVLSETDNIPNQVEEQRLEIQFLYKLCKKN